MSDLAAYCITSALQSLLGSKHLYQSVDVNTEPIRPVLESVKDVFESDIKIQRETAAQLAENHWYPNNELNLDVIKKVTSGVFAFQPPDLKLFCPLCDGREAHNPTSASAALAPFAKSKSLQVFVFSYLCQSCKKFPQTFLVRRESLKLILCGRSPIEFVETPSYVPKRAREYLKNAIVAYQSGQVLAGNFLLRTLIEQWTRLATGAIIEKKADEVLSIYLTKLTKDFKDRFPSLSDIYSELSADIHAAGGSEDVFEKAHIKICEHFDALRLFKVKFDTENGSVNQTK